MLEQLNLFQDTEKNYKIIHFSGGMIDTNGDAIYFVKTIQNGLTKNIAVQRAEELNIKVAHRKDQFYDARGSSTKLV